MTEDPRLAELRRHAIEMQLRFEHVVAAGNVSEADQKAWQAKMADHMAQIDDLAGVADVTYEQFRAAFDRGASDDELLELIKGMNPKDPLKVDAKRDRLARRGRDKDRS